MYDEGRIAYTQTLSNYVVEVNLKDHLGNVRAVFDNKTGVAKQVTAYYPFGMQINQLSATTAVSRNINEYKYNGKMFQDENNLNWYDYGARFYDAVVGRWWSVDPLAEKYRRWSPYNYCVDNPIQFIDPDGMQIDKYYDNDGTLLYDTKEGDREFILKTTSTKAQLLASENVKESEIADVDGISETTAEYSADQVSAGNINGDHMDNFVELDPQSSRVAMYETVKMGKDDGSGGLKPSNNREVGSTISATNGVGPPTYGPVSDLLSSSYATILFENLKSGDRTFHGHPSGSTGSTSWSQLPSKIDQNNAGPGNHYVFPMQKGQQNVYLYNNKGIQAIVPYKFFKR